MSLDFYLYPNDVRNQSDAMMRKMTEDNEAYRQSITAMNSFVADAYLTSRAYEVLKARVEDYRRVVDALLDANNLDIVDGLTLNSAVGDEDLIGSVIFMRQEIARGNIEHHGERAANYRRLMALDSAMNDGAGAASFSAMARAADDLVRINQELLTYWQEKEEKYYRIEGETSALFTRTTALRNSAATGLVLIGQAASGFPNLYDSGSLVAWRNEMRELHADVHRTTETAILNILDKLMLGEIDVSAVIGDPVTIATGNYLYKYTDLEIKGYNPLVFQRFYNSKSGRVDSLGKNWSHNYEIFASETNKGVHIFYGEDGHSEFHEKGKDGSYLPSVYNKFSNLTKNEDNIYSLKRLDGSTYLFDSVGFVRFSWDRRGRETKYDYQDLKLAKVTTESGHLTFTYNKSNLVGVKDHSGRQIKFTYKGKLLTSFTDTEGNSYQYGYDEKSLLSKITNPDGVVLVETKFDGENRAIHQQFSDQTTMEYRYDDKKRSADFVQQNGTKITYKKDSNDHTTFITYPDGTEEEFKYHKKQKVAQWDRLENRKMFAKYDDKGNLISNIDALDVETKFKYTEDNQLEKLTIDGNEKVNYIFDKDNNMVALEDGLKNKTTFEYKEKDLVERVIQADGSEMTILYDERKNVAEIKNTHGVVTKYQYDSLNRVIATIDGNGNKTYYRYDGKNNIIEVKNALGDRQFYGYNKSNNVVSFKDYDNSVEKREYNSINKVSKMIDKLGRETKINYDCMWNVAHVIEANGAETHYIYNDSNQLESIKKADDSVIRYEYDANGNRVGFIDELGNRTWFVYDEKNQLVEINGKEGCKFKYTYNGEGKITTVTDGLGNTVNYVYDKNGQLVQETNAMGESRFYTYTSIGRKETVKDESGLVTTYCYEKGGRLNKIIFSDGTEESYTYDKAGNIKSRRMRTGQRMNYVYDSLNRIVKIIGSQGEVKSYTYDAVSNVISRTDELGNVTYYEYTLTKKLSKVTDGMGNVALYTYDEGDYLIEVQHVGAESIGPDEDLQQVIARNEENKTHRITRYERDKMGRITVIVDSLGGKESFQYDGKGQLIEKLDKDGFLTKYIYTSHGDLNQIKYADGREVKMQYNPLRQLIEVEDWLGKTQIEVDPLGRATKVTNHRGKEVEYAWGIKGELRSLIYPNGKKVVYDYDEYYRLKEVDDENCKVSYFYNQQSQPVEKAYSKGMKSKYSYDAIGRLRELTHFDKDNQVLDKYQYSYDLAGNKIAIEKLREHVLEDNGLFEYSYDSLSRLCKVSQNGELLRMYEYDSYGNRTLLREGSCTTKYEYNALNQLVSIVDDQETIQNYSYDNRGNLIESYRNNELTHQYHFGALNRLEKSYNFEKEIGAEYFYNGLGHQAETIQGKSMEPMSDDGGIDSLILKPDKKIKHVIDLTRQYHNVLEREENQELTSYTWDFNLLSAMGDKGNSKYMQDELGSPMRVFNEGDTVPEVFCYDEYGNISNGEKADEANPFTYTGYQFDSISDTMFAQARQYNPKWGRFISEDTVKGDLTLPKTQNLYSYCLNQPLKYIDLDGNIPSLNPQFDFIPDDWYETLEELAYDMLWGLRQPPATVRVVEAIGDAVTNAIDSVRDVINNESVDEIFDSALTIPIFIPNPRHPMAPTPLPVYVYGYRGQITIQVPWLDGTSAASVGYVMILQGDLYPGNIGNLPDHEHGHFLQYLILGFQMYLFGIAIPSLHHYELKLVPTYMQPWEVHADMMVRIIRPEHTIEMILLSIVYFNYLKSIECIDTFARVDFSNFLNMDFSAIKEDWL